MMGMPRSLSKSREEVSETIVDGEFVAVPLFVTYGVDFLRAEIYVDEIHFFMGGM